jgi:hypothetical protein
VREERRCFLAEQPEAYAIKFVVAGTGLVTGSAAGSAPPRVPSIINNLDNLTDAQLLARLRSLTEQVAPLMGKLDGDDGEDDQAKAPRH